MEGRGTEEGVRVPVGMSDKSTEGENGVVRARLGSNQRGYDGEKWGVICK